MANEPINKALYNRVKSEAKQKFDRWPSAYGSAWLVKEYKRRGGKYKQDGGGMSPDALKSMQSFYEDFQSNKFDADAFKKTANNLYDLGLKNEGTKTSYLKSVKGPGLFGTGLFGKNYYKRPGLFSKDTYYTDVNVQKGLDQKGNPYYVPFDEYNNENLIEPINDLPEFPEMAQGGGIPERYRNMGFNKVGAKKQSNRPGKKWMVLAKKGDKYKVVHGGYKGMKDFTQHGNPKRRERFWDRMGGRDSAKAKDPFSPLYWHKRFGTWQEGGQYNYDINNPIPQFEMGNSILSKMQNEAMRKGYLKQGGTPCYECGGSYAKGGTNNPGFKALPPYVQQKIKSNMQTGGMTPFNANPDYYNERLRNFIDLVNGTASDSLFSEMEQEGMMPQARYGMSYLPLAQNGKEQKVPYVYYKGKLMPYDEADRMLPQFDRFPKGTKIYNEYGDEIGTIRDYGQTVKGGKPKFEFKAADPNLTQEKLEEFANLFGQEALANAMAEGLIDEYTPVSRFIDQTMGRGVTAATNPFAEASTINYNNIADDNILTDPDIKRAYADDKAANNQNNSRTGSGTGSNTGSGAATSTGASGARATVKQQFEEINGPGSWQRAKDAGLTDGSAEANLALLERAQNNEDVFADVDETEETTVPETTDETVEGEVETKAEGEAETTPGTSGTTDQTGLQQAPEFANISSWTNFGNEPVMYSDPETGMVMNVPQEMLNQGASQQFPVYLKKFRQGPFGTVAKFRPYPTAGGSGNLFDRIANVFSPNQAGPQVPPNMMEGNQDIISQLQEQKLLRPRDVRKMRRQELREKRGEMFDARMDMRDERFNDRMDRRANRINERFDRRIERNQDQLERFQDRMQRKEERRNRKAQDGTGNIMNMPSDTLSNQKPMVFKSMDREIVKKKAMFSPEYRNNPKSFNELFTLTQDPKTGEYIATPKQKYGGMSNPYLYMYKEGGEYYMDENTINMILAMGGNIEFID